MLISLGRHKRRRLGQCKPAQLDGLEPHQQFAEFCARRDKHVVFLVMTEGLRDADDALDARSGAAPCGSTPAAHNTHRRHCTSVAVVA
jgi:hypothetical protein